MPIERAKNFAQYQKNYQKSIENPEDFWREEAKSLHWFKQFTQVKSADFNVSNHHIRWFEDGILNVSYNCLDRHLEKNGEKVAYIWEADDGSSKTITYRGLHEQVCKFSNVLKSLGVRKSDTVVIYLPMVLEAIVAMLACSRIGAVHSVVFAGFSAGALADRITDSAPKLLITAEESIRGGKKIPLLDNVKLAFQKVHVDKAIIIGASNEQDFGYDYKKLMSDASDECIAEEMRAEDPLFILYTSGSTGKPKGIVHTTAGYLLYASMTHHHVFAVEEKDVYWCTADIGWITGHSYVVYGPLANCTTSVVFEGVPTYPEPDRYWKIIDKYNVSIFYTAPTALRSLLRFGDNYVLKHKLTSLKLLGTVGEPIDPNTWQWYFEIVGKGKCHIADTWWQTETGGIMIVPLPNVCKLKPGSASLPFYGIEPEIMQDGALVIKNAWPGMLRDVYKNHQRLLDTYFKDFPGCYVSGDGARKDEDGYLWIKGRMDDVLKVSGHRISTAEIEAVLEDVREVAECAVVGYPHEIKGESIYAYVVLKNQYIGDEALKKKLNDKVRTEIGPIASIEKCQLVDDLPKTRSGKVMRRILRKIASGERAEFGDTSTLTDPSVLQKIIKNAL